MYVNTVSKYVKYDIGVPNENIPFLRLNLVLGYA